MIVITGPWASSVLYIYQLAVQVVFLFFFYSFFSPFLSREFERERSGEREPKEKKIGPDLQVSELG
jgi:hypothetical protein